MGKREIKLNGIKLYTVLFIIVSVFIFLPFITNGLSTVWSIDGVGQYYPAFLYNGQFLRSLLSTGKFMSFDLRIAMGEDVFSALNYYGLGDPLNILAIFSNTSNGVYLFAFMFFLRLYLAGISFIAYCRYMHLDEKLIVPGAFMYLCSGYTFCACLMYIEFLSPLIYFPLLLLSCEMFFREKKWLPMVLTSAYGALCTMYLFYYAALVLVPYVIIRSWCIYEKNIKRMLIQCISCGGLCVSGIIITFPILYPSLRGMLISERAGGDIIGILTSLTNYRPRRYNTIQFFKGFLPTYDEGVYFFHEIPVVSYVVIILLFLSVFLYKNRSRRNMQLLVSVIIGCAAFTIPITNIVFSGFVEGFSYDRWIFMLEFLFALVFVCVGQEFISYISDKKKKENAYKIISGVVVANVVAIGLILYAFAGKEFTNTFIKFKDIKKYTDSPVNYSEIIKNDKGLYRISNDSLTNINGRPENVQMINDYNGLTFWLSVVNPNMQKIADKLPELNAHGFVDQRMFGLENGKVAESLAGVKYYLNRDNVKFPSDYKPVEEIDFYGDNWIVYENPDALPLVYGYERDFYDSSLGKYYYEDNALAIDEATPALDVIYDNDIVECKIKMESDGVVILAIPYSEGWSVTIDGNDATVYNSCIYYMAVDVEKGEHTLRYNYSSYHF